MNPSDMTEDTTSTWATASLARKGAHKLNLRPFKKKSWIPAYAGMTGKNWMTRYARPSGRRFAWFNALRAFVPPARG
jgi:hypothetical protein